MSNASTTTTTTFTTTITTTTVSPFSLGVDRYKWIVITGIIPVCCLGLLTNSLAVQVWNANRKLNSMVLLFQLLGVLDNLFLLGSLVRGVLYYLDSLPTRIDIVLVPVLFFSQSLSTHVTAAITVFRWMAVARPQRTLQGRLLLRRIVLACAGLGLWCGLLTVSLMASHERLDHLGEAYVAKEVTLQVLGYVLPTLVLLVFSLLLLRVTFRHQRKMSNKTHGKLTMAVLCIATSTFLACPVAVSGQLLGVLAPNRDQDICDWICAFVAFGVGELLQVINSAINFFFYLLFASKFRPLLLKNYGCCLRLFHSARRRASSAAERGSDTQDSSVREPVADIGPPTEEIKEDVTPV